MKIIIAGGRDFVPTQAHWTLLDDLRKTVQWDEVVSGGARGADRFGELWGRSRGIHVRVFPADWERYGRRAGPLRNIQMAEYADGVVLFPGGTGTAHMARTAASYRLRIWDYRNENVA